MNKRNFCRTLVLVLVTSCGVSGLAPICLADEYEHLLMTDADVQALIDNPESTMPQFLKDRLAKGLTKDKLAKKQLVKEAEPENVYRITKFGDMQILRYHAKPNQPNIYIIRGDIDMHGTEWNPPYREWNPFEGFLLFEKGSVLRNKVVVADGEGSFLGVMGSNGYIFNENDSTQTKGGKLTQVTLPVLRPVLKKVPFFCCCCGGSSIEEENAQ
ncbi:hypothetical protein FACS189481_1340 [Clostridia bacterium]|nr:hypothetical protein FACS189481_1340 [Clostridia bacterium]